MILVDFAPVLPDFFSLGLVGIGLVSWLGDDGSDDVDQEGDADDDFDMEEDDDEFGMDGFDDDFGEMDGMEEGGGGEASSTELENRLEDLESEVANVSSTANTVRSENEQISEKVEDVEENVRKLLEIYEMVTRGVNPFVDDVNAEAGMGGGGGGDFGLFAEEESESGGGDEEEDLGTDIADAEAEDFFEDDAFDEELEDEEAFEEAALDDEVGDEDAFEGDEMAEGGEEMDEDFGDFEEDSMTEDDAFDESEPTETDDDSADGSEGGTSFEELKAEYESGDADWAEEGEKPDSEPESESTASETVAEPADADQEDLFHQDDLEAGAGAKPEATDSAPESANQTAADGAAASPGGGAEAGQAPGTGMETQPAGGATGAANSTASNEPEGEFQFGAATAAESAEQPHLAAPPNGYLSDVLIMEWLDFLVTEFDARNAIRAINHYERIGWIGETMRDHCYEVLQGVADSKYPYRDESGPTELTMDDHRQSLWYIENLATGHLDRELGDRITSLTTNGVQR